MTNQLEQMSRKEIRDYLRRNPTDEQAWEIFFQKLEESPKQKLTSLEEVDDLIAQKSNSKEGTTQTRSSIRSRSSMPQSSAPQKAYPPSETSTSEQKKEQEED